MAHSGYQSLLLAGMLLSATALPANSPEGQRDIGKLTSWQLQIDNDALATGGRDRNYTGGILYSQSGSRTAERLLSLDPWLAKNAVTTMAK